MNPRPIIYTNQRTNLRMNLLPHSVFITKAGTQQPQHLNQVKSNEWNTYARNALSTEQRQLNCSHSLNLTRWSHIYRLTCSQPMIEMPPSTGEPTAKTSSTSHIVDCSFPNPQTLVRYSTANSQNALFDIRRCSWLPPIALFVHGKGGLISESVIPTSQPRQNTMNTIASMDHSRQLPHKRRYHFRPRSSLVLSLILIPFLTPPKKPEGVRLKACHLSTYLSRITHAPRLTRHM